MKTFGQEIMDINDSIKVKMLFAEIIDIVSEQKMADQYRSAIIKILDAEKEIQKILNEK